MKFALLPLFIASAVFATPVARQMSVRTYNIVNHCSSDITVYTVTDGAQHDLVAANGSVVKVFLAGNDVRIYTDANGGNSKGTQSIRANFHGDNLYYIVADGNNGAGVNIQPTTEGCAAVECDNKGCDGALSQDPFSFPAVAQPPLHSCPQASFEITLCPNGKFAGQ